MKIKVKMNNRSHSYDIKRPRFRNGYKYSKSKKCLSMMMLICYKQYPATLESHFIKKLSNTRTELKKRIAYKKSVKESVN